MPPRTPPLMASSSETMIRSIASWPPSCSAKLLRANSARMASVAANRKYTRPTASRRGASAPSPSGGPNAATISTSVLTISTRISARYSSVRHPGVRSAGSEPKRLSARTNAYLPAPGSVAADMRPRFERDRIALARTEAAVFVTAVPAAIAGKCLRLRNVQATDVTRDHGFLAGLLLPACVGTTGAQPLLDIPPTPGDVNHQSQQNPEQDSTHRASCPMQDDLEHEPAAHVSEQEHHESHQRPAQRGAAAPAEIVPTDQQTREHHPGRDREDRLVIEPQRTSEKLFRKQHARDQGRRQQHEAGPDQAKEQPLHCEQRWHLG